MKNVNLDILLNIINRKNNFNSNLHSVHDKMPMSSLINNYKIIPATKYMKQSLTKFHRPMTTKTKSHSLNKNNNNYKYNEFQRPIPIIYNTSKKKERNSLSGIKAKDPEYIYNSSNTNKINIIQKINGKHIEEFLLKSIIPLPEIREENNLMKKSIAIINKSKERVANINNSKSHFLMNADNPNLIMRNKTNNIIIFNNEINNKIGNIKNNKRYYQGENKENKDKYINNKKISDKNKNLARDNSYDNTYNIMLLKSLENRLKNEHNPLYNSFQPPPKIQKEIKNTKINNNNLSKINEAKVQNDQFGISNLIITNNKIFPEKNYIIYNQSNLPDSYEALQNSKISNDKNSNIIKNILFSKHNSAEKSPKEKEPLIKYPNFKCLYYSILPGNASYLVEKCMKHRINWIKPFSVVSTLFNFKWQELSYGIDYGSLGCFTNIKQIVNHFENHFVISNKAKMFINLLNYCEKRNISVFKYVPFTIIFNLKDENEINKDNKKIINDKNNKYENLKEMINSLEKYIKKYEEIGNFYHNENYQKYMSYIKSKERRGDFKNINYNDYKRLSKRKNKLLKKHKKRNILSSDIKKRDTEENKNKIEGYTLYSDYFNNLIQENNIPIYDKNKEKAYEEEINKKNNKFGVNPQNEKNIIGTNTCIEIPNTHFSGKNMWIVKAINLNRGMCMKIVNSYEQMVKVINKFKEGVDYNFTKEKIDENNNSNDKSLTSLNKSTSKLKKSITSRILRKTLNSEDKTKTIMVNKENKDIIMNKNNIKLVKNGLNAEDKNPKTKINTMENINNNDINKNKIEEEKKINEIKEKEKLYNCNRIIIQKYIENPLLYRGRKFDMRIWVLLTYTMKVYVFKEGHLKTCSIEYNLNSKDVYAHITNYSFQKYNTNFQKYEKGNEVPFFEFQNFLDETYPRRKYNVKKNLIPQIKEIIKLTMRSAKYKINKNRRNYQFEIFGYDFMMDTEFNLFLIEINTNPGLEESSPWIKLIVPRMLDDALRLNIDQLFETKYDFDLIYKSKEYNNVYNNILNRYNKIVKDNEIFDKDENSKEINEDNKDTIKNNDGENKLMNSSTKMKNNDNKQKNYISPFPVPGYSLDENIWEFVCDLDDPDPLDELSDKEDENIIENEKSNHKHKNYTSKSYKKGKKLN